MPQLLTTNAQIQCPHGGTGTTTPMSQTAAVQGGYLLAEGDTGQLSCPDPYYPCIGYVLKSMGLNATTIAERKAVLATDFQQSYTGLPLTIIETQQVAMDDTMPVGTPGGEEGEELRAALGDLSEPVVTVAPPSLAFDSNAGTPPTLTATFSLFSDHPMEWMLTLINPVQGVDVDLTAGAPGAVVTPPGGSWVTPALGVSLTLSAAFMAALGKTPPLQAHAFYLTGVSRRGKSGHAVFELTVT